MAFITPNLVLGGAEYWILGLLKYCDPARIAFSGVVVTNSDACDEAMCREAAAHAPIYGGPVKKGTLAHHGDGGYVRRFASLREAFGRLCADSDVLIAWGVSHLPRFLDGLGFGGQVVLVSHGGGEWTESVLKTSRPAAQRFAAVSRAAAEAFHSPDVSVIHNGGDHDRCRITLPRDEVRRAWGAGADEKLIGYVGRFSWEKNPLAAAVAARELGPPFRAVYIGEGWKSDEVKSAALDVAPDAIFVPPQHQIGNALNALDLLLLASPSEGFSLALTEAWLCGLPTVATRVGAVPELEPVHGQLVTPLPARPTTDQLAAAVREALSAENRTVVERASKAAWANYTAQAMADRWTTFLLDCVSC